MMKYKVFVNLICLLLVLLLVFDAISGFNYGGTGDRTNYQLVLYFLTSLLLCFCFFTLKSRKTKIINSLLFLNLYIFISDSSIIVAGNQSKLLGFAYSLLWVLLVNFSYYTIHRYPHIISNYKKYIYSLFFISVIATVSGFLTFSDQYNVILAPGVYTTLVFFPWLQIQRKSLLKTISSFILVVVVVLSFKRGAILALLVCFFINEWVNIRISNRKTLFKNAVKALFGVVFVLFLFFIANERFDGRLVERFSMESIKDGSGRSNSNEIALDAILNKSNLETFLIGFSSDELYLEDFIGHNDWLVFFINYGFLGFLLYLSFYINLFSYLIHLIKDKSQYAVAFSSVFIIMFLMSFYSTSYGPTVHPIFTMLFVGFIQGITINEKQNGKNDRGNYIY